MIKKIGSNKYGVVEYAISSVEDIADLPLGVAIGSTAVLINKDGIRTFALGEGEWVEYIDAERYDKNKLAQDLLFCGFGNDGEKHDDLDDRLIAEFDEINERVNVGNYLGYNGCHVKADYSLEGLQRGVMLEGRTLQNLCVGEGDYHGYYNDTTKMYDAKNNKQPLSFNLKPNTTYTRIMYDCEFEGGYIHMFDSVNEADGTYKQYPYYLRGTTCATTFTTGEKGGINEYVFNPEHGTAWTPGFSVKVGKLVILEGDHTETPLSELPFIEGIESVGESELTDDGYKISGKSCGRNLIDPRSGYTAMPNYLNAVIKNDVLTLDINPQPQTTRSVTYQFELKDIILNVGDIYAISGKVEFENVANIRILMVSPNTTSNTASYYIFGEGEFKGNLVVKEALTHKESLKYQYPLSIEVNVTPKDYTQPQKVVLSNFQLEKNDFATPYEQYQESTYSYILDEPLHSLPNGVCDTIDFETGVLTRRVGKIVFDGSESWIKSSNHSNENFNDFRVGMNGLINKNKENGICDRFVYSSKNSINNDWIGREEAVILYAHVNMTEVIFSMPVSKFNNLETFKQWLQANPTTIYYELLEPTIHQLDQNRLYSFKDTTHITSDNLIVPRITTNILTNSNALISRLKGENLALTNEVSTLSLRNRETQETNETQDHIIDASLCAVDELYMMYETTQEVEAMSADEEGSRMVDMYVAMVQRGLKTIDQVPVRYREKVREILAQLED